MSTNVTETLQFNCTTCPSECLLTVEVERDANGAVAAVRFVTRQQLPARRQVRAPRTHLPHARAHHHRGCIRRR